MNVLSLFDGMSCGQIALERSGIKVDNYYASEIDKYAIAVTQHNYPDTIHLGDINNWEQWDLPSIDLLIGGSPCQGFSFAGKQLNFDDPRSKLFFEYVNILNDYQPKYFLLENVKMKQEYQDIISEYLGVEPIEINSALVSAQNRKRLYWTNVPNILQPEDKNIILSSILLDNDKTEQLKLSDNEIQYMNKAVSGGRTHWDFAHHSDTSNNKSSAVVANFYRGVPYNVLKDDDVKRKFHPIECERLQTVPDNYTNLVSNTQRYKMLGNGWTVDVTAHIFNHMKGLI